MGQSPLRRGWRGALLALFVADLVTPSAPAAASVSSRPSRATDSTPSAEADAEAIARVRAAMRACVNHGLRRHPNLPTNVRLSLHVTRRGVVDVAHVTPTTMPADVATCITTRASAIAFAPRNNDATFVIPTTE